MGADDIKIFPIFEQNLGIWRDFARIYRAASPCADSGFKIMDRLTQKWLCPEKKIAFGAYHNNKMVGFINVSRTTNAQNKSYGFVEHLYVLPDYQRDIRKQSAERPRVGARLLSAVEKGVRLFGGNSISLHSLVDAGDFYASQDYWVDTNDEAREVYWCTKELEDLPPADGVYPVFHVSPMMSTACFDVAYSIFKKESLATDVRVAFEKATNGNCPAFVALRDGVIRGFLDGRKSSFSNVATVEQLYVHKKFQKHHGLGTALLTDFCDFAENAGASRVSLLALRDFGARTFYGKFGFALQANSTNRFEKEL